MGIVKKREFFMGCCRSFLLFCFASSFFFLGTHQLQSSQTQVLLQLRKHLEYPRQLEIWNDHTIDFCSISSLSQVHMTCLDNLVTELRVVGDKPATVSDFNGFSIPNQTLSEAFSLDSFVTTLARLNSLKVLSLVSLGIWGQLPDKIHRLSSLQYLDLSSNYLFGSIPPKVSAMVKLQTLKFDDNFLNETMPNWFDSLSNITTLSLRNNQLKGSLPDLSSSSSLHVLDLSGNKLNSKLPSMPKGLIMLLLSNNSFSGEIPKKYCTLSGLQHLDVSHNAIRGTPLAALFSLPNMSYLNLASNLLSGSLPGHLICGSKLDYIDISNNSLTGELPFCLRTESEKRIVKFGGNCLSIGMQHQHELSYCKEVSPKEKQYGGKDVGILVGVILGLVVLTVLLVLSFIIFCRRYYPRGISEQHLLHKSVEDNSAVGLSSEILANARYISQAAKVGIQGLPVCRTFALEELMEATNNFDNSVFLGEGSYGKLYKGRLYNGTLVSIRCLPLSKKYSIRNVKLRLDLLAKLRHPHLVCLLGHCLHGGVRDEYSPNKVYLVSEYVPNGNFRAHLSGNSPGKVLDWSERLAVLISVAKAVQFLHTGIIPGFFCNRLKTNNILLNEHGMAKLSDYGLSILAEETDKSKANDGLSSWQMTSLEDDAYSFGYILLEALVGPSKSDRREAFMQNDMASLNSLDGRKKIVEPIVLATCSQESLSIVISITNKCICPESSRPSFEDILWNLQYAVQVQATADGDRRFDSASHQY
ncbi:hypothetical protein PRUPE_5G153400 [Prunus persica]|uniref:Protein kinase domain-containing protein n=1 Tax=Prunus persica TaxID=3760 RepID=A0A251P8W0_PRUPE|nr:probable inactive leucine-rich repeat receptor-like protein kinase At3g03770 [Prunus persica]ONI08015.1 hypothetical protein PRUPE_5G153400 [Prunus persica]ONI08016.1 hypothetical protein PRUPE_5G153400 [Prunus persica]ONI08017.1 hypothetical protein PRUPE_5G153400 [Prunus persica]ONI08018.1 hypothetical protein PRUPE_5G153400 [Prunus persica]